jgi:hypothetical protein
MTRRPALLGLALGTILLAPVAGAQIRTATFGEYARPTTTEHQATIGAPVTSGGLDFYDTDAFPSNVGARNVLGSWGRDPSADPVGVVNQPTNVGSSNAMFATLLGEEIDVFGAGTDVVTGPGVPFGMISIDVAHLYSTAYAPFTLLPINLTFFGFGASTGGSVIEQSFTIPAPPAVGDVRTPLLTTLTFDERWRSVENVWWFQGAGSGSAHQFTNVVSSVVPEPGTYLLTLTGLGGLAAVRLRRRRRSA